jgi:hypothetical protein
MVDNQFRRGQNSPQYYDRGAQPRRQRVVTLAQEVEPTAWNDFAERREQRFRARARQETYTHVRPRTHLQRRALAQGGQVGQARTPRRSLPQSASPVPRRSGRQRRGFVWKLLSLFTLALAAVLGTTFAVTGTAFRVEQVNVDGTHNRSLVETIQHMGMQGQNIFLADVTSLAARVAALPTVASANVSRQWPNQLTVTVSERQPVLLWQARNGAYSVDEQGVVVAPASETPGASHLMVVMDTRTHNGNGKLQPGQHVNVADVQFALTVFASLPKMAGVSAFTLKYTDSMPLAPGETGSFVVASQSGWLAYLGGTGDSNPLDNRLLELQRILTMAQQQQLHLATVDLRFGLRPVYTLQS